MMGPLAWKTAASASCNLARKTDGCRFGAHVDDRLAAHDLGAERLRQLRHIVVTDQVGHREVRKPLVRAER